MKLEQLGMRWEYISNADAARNPKAVMFFNGNLRWADERRVIKKWKL